MMPTKDSVTCPPLILLGSQQDIPIADSFTQDARPLPSPIRLPGVQPDIRANTNNNNKFETSQKLVMDNRFGGEGGSGDSNNNSMSGDNTKTGSGRRGDPIEILHFSQESAYNFEDEEEGSSVIPPSPERPHGPTLGPKSPITRDNMETGDNNTYASLLGSPDKTGKSPNWHSAKRAQLFPWEIQRRITFSQESSQQSMGTPHETQECLSSFVQRQMSPDKALKRSYYSSSEEADAKKRKTSPTKNPTTSDFCTVRSPYSGSQNNIRNKESPHSKEGTPQQTPPSFFKVRLKVPPAIPDPQFSEKATPSPSVTSASKEPTWDSDQCYSGTQNWHLRLSDSQDSQSQSEATPQVSQMVITRTATVEAPTVQPDFSASKKGLPLDNEFMSPVKRGHHSSSSRSVGYRLVDRKHQDVYKKRTSTPCDLPGSADNSLDYSKSTYRTIPPLVLQLSRQSTITPTSCALTTTPSPCHLSQLSEEHISPPPSQRSQQDKVLVDSTETSAIFHQISNSSIDSSPYDSSLGLNKNLSPEKQRITDQVPANLHTSTEQPSPLPQDSRSASAVSDKSAGHNQKDMHLEGLSSNQQLQSKTPDGPPVTNVAPSKDASKFLFSPELNVGNGDVTRQKKKRPHSDEEFVRNVRRTRDCCVQTDSTAEGQTQSSQTQTVFLAKDHMTGGSQSQSEAGTFCRIRDAGYRYRDHIVDGCIVKCERISFEERTYDNCKLEDLPSVLAPPVDSNQNWSSLTSGEMGDVSSSVPSSKSGSISSLQSFNIPNSMSQLPQFHMPKIKKNRRSVSLHTLVEKQSSQATPQSSISTTSSFSPAIHGTEQDDNLFAKPQEPSEASNLPSKETPKTPAMSTGEEPPKVAETPWSTPTKRSGGRSHKKGHKRQTYMPKRRTPKSASPKKKLPLASSISSPETQAPVINASPEGEEVEGGEEDEENPVSPGRFKPGMQVMARWKDSYFYSGTLAEMDTTGKWEVNFEDGSQRCVKESDILDETLVVKGQSVLSLSKDGYYDPGIVQSLYVEDKEQGFIVDLDTGASVRCKRGSVILSSDQAASLLRRSNVEHPVAAVSLDNIVEGKRRRTPKSFADNGSPATASRPMATRALGVLPQQPPFQPTRRRCRPDPNIQSSDYNSSYEEHKECPSLIPRLKMKLQRSKKDPDQYWCSDAEPEEVPESSKISPPSMEVPAPVEVRSPKKASPKKSPKKSSPTKNTPKNNTSKSSSVQADAMEEGLGPFSEDKEIFQGLYFLISCADRSASQNKLPQDSIGSSESSADDSDAIPHLERDHVSLQLQNAGGVVLESYEETVSVPKKQVILISNTYLRTLKYIKCLAAGIPCVSVNWVNDCCQQSIRLQLKEYMLPAGYSIVGDCVIDWKNRSSKSNTLCNLHIMLWSEKNPDFVSFWTPVILAAQATAVARPSDTSRLTGSFSHVNVVVADPSLPTNIYRHFRDHLNVPVVSSEWLIQCIITGQRLRVDEHPKFKHTFVNG